MTRDLKKKIPPDQILTNLRYKIQDKAYDVSPTYDNDLLVDIRTFVFERGWLVNLP